MKKRRGFFNKMSLYTMAWMGFKKAQFDEKVFKRFVMIERIFKKENEHMKELSKLSWGSFLHSLEICYVLDDEESIERGLDIMDHIIAYQDYTVMEADVWEYIKEIHPEFILKRIELIKIRYPQVTED